MSADNYPITTNTILPIVINNATTTDAGVMSAADKLKLDGLSPGGGGAVIFDDAVPGTDVNIRSDRAANQSTIDNTKVGITNLGSSTAPSAGATDNYSTIGGGDQNSATGRWATVPGGLLNIASGDVSHAEGFNTQAAGDGSHAEGSRTQAIGHVSHSEGTDGIASGQNAHVEGDGGHADGESSHVEGHVCTATGVSAHAEGSICTATGNASHASGLRAIALRDGQFAHSSGPAATPTNSRSQASIMTMAGETPGLAPGESVELLYGPTPGQQLVLEDGHAYTLVITAIAVGPIAIIPSNQSFRQMLSFRRVGAATVLAASGTPEQIGEAGSSSWTFAVTAAAGPSRIAITFTTGVTTSAVRVTAKIELVEIFNP